MFQLQEIATIMSLFRSEEKNRKDRIRDGEEEDEGSRECSS